MRVQNFSELLIFKYFGSIEKSTSINKFLSACLIFSLLSFSSNSQILKSKYDRNVVSFGATFDKSEVNIDWSEITPSYIETAPFSGFVVKKKEINNSLIENKIPNKIISSLLFYPNGKINYEYIFNRGEYNAIDAEVALSNLAKEGNSLIQNSGFEVLDNIHIIIYDEYEVNYGIFSRIKYRAYLYKIRINKENFWSEVIDSNTNKLSVEKLNNLNLTLDLVATRSSNNIQRSFNKLGRVYKSSRVTANIIGTNPITAKIGTKEGLRVNDLFQVLENKQNNKGNIVQISKGYVRVKTLANNLGKSNGNSKSSTFYKTFSGSLDNGMILRSVPNRGIFIGGSKFFSKDNNSLLSGYNYQVDYLSHKYKGIYYSLGIGISDTIRSNSYILPGGKENKDLTAILSGLNIMGMIGKNISINVLEISPEIGFYAGSYGINKNLYRNNLVNSNTNFWGLKDKESITPMSFITGLKIGLNVGKSIQIYGSVNYLIGNSNYNLNSSENLKDEEKTKLTFNNMPTFKIGIRLFQL